MAFNDGKGYVGAICDGTANGNNADMHAYIMEFDPANPTTFSLVKDFDLSYTRESSQYTPSRGTCDLGSQSDWNHWGDTWAELGNALGYNTTGATDNTFGAERACPQPILSDITFDSNGDMILAFMDRFSLQLDRVNYAADTNFGTNRYYSSDSGGDLLHLCKTANGYLVEGEAGCIIDSDTKINGDTPNDRLKTDDGPNGQGEFYYQDYSTEYDYGKSAHHVETILGSAISLPGSSQVLTTVFDSILGDFNQGFLWFNTNTATSGTKGGRVNQYQISKEGDNDINTKGSALGDIEFLLPPAPIEIGNYVWDDADKDGIQDPDESPLANVTLELWVDTDGDGYADTKVGETQTDSSGEYYFGGDTNAGMTGVNQIEPDTTYEIRIALNDPNLNGKIPTLQDVNDPADDMHDSDGDNGVLNVGYSTITYTTGDYGENDHTLDFGFHDPVVSIGSLVWEDSNGDGLQTSGEPGIAGAVVTLLDSSNNPIPGKQTTTGTDGKYFFDNLPPGDYKVKVDMSNVSGYIPTPTQNSNANDDTDNDSNIATTISSQVYVSSTVTLTAGGEPTETGGLAGTDNADDADESNGNMTVDFGFIPNKVSIGSTVFYDLNDNGTQDQNESGIPNVAVKLYDENGTVVATTNTDSNGNYLFDNLDPGKYQVGVIPPSDAPLSSTTTDTNDDQKDGDDNGIQTNAGDEALSPSIDLQPGQEPDDNTETFQGGNQDTVDVSGDMTVDFGFVPTFDLALIKQLAQGQASSVEPGGTVTFTITVYNQGTVEATNIQVNDYIPTGLTLNDSAWTASGSTATLNTPIASLAAGASTTVDITFTVDADFTGTSITNNAEIASASNSLNLADKDSTPGSEDGSTPDPQDDDVNNTTGGDDYDPATIGVAPKVSIGSTVFYDLNDNGIQDQNESGIAGVTVKLYKDDNGDGQPDGAAVETNTTDSNGNYYFGNLEPGKYVVGVTAPTDAPLSSTTTDTNDDQKDGDDNGIQTNAGDEALSPSIDLQPGQEPDDNTETFQGGNQDTVDVSGDMTVDFGFVKVVSLGSVVWNDLNNNGIQDAGESGIAGAIVTLLDGNGNPVTGIDSQTTGNDGIYYFDNLPEGEYQVQVDMSNVPGYIPAANQNNNPDDDVANDSNIDSVDGQTYISGVVLLTAGNEPTETGGLPGTDDSDNNLEATGNMTVDFGFFKPQPAIDVEKSTNGQDADTTTGPGLEVGDAITWTYVISNTGNEVLNHIALADDKEGSISCPQTTLAIGESMTCMKTGVVPASANGVYENTATVTATSAFSNTPVTDNDPSHYHVLNGSITGNVISVNANGNNPQPIPNVVLVLFDANGNEVARTTTNASGYYVFDNVVPGHYVIQQIQPTQYYSVSEDEGGADDDATNPLINTLSVVVSTNETDVQNDFVESRVDAYTCNICKPTVCNTCATGTAANVSTDTATIKWRPTTNEVGYEIYVNGKFVRLVDKDVTSYTLTNLESDKNYKVEVVALGKKGGELKQTITFKTKAVPAGAWLPAIYGLLLQ